MMRLFIGVLLILAIAAGVAMLTRPGEAEFDAMLKEAVQQKIATTDIGSQGDDAIGTVALIGCKLRPTDCVNLLRDALDVTMTDHKLYTSFTVKGLKRETTCTGAFTKIWCQRPVMGD
jgi:hypothetical protein